MKKVKFIFNPHSGGGSIVNILDQLILKFQEKGLFIVPYRIDVEKDEQEYFPEYPDVDYEYILIAGGDGTVNQVVNQMKLKNIELPIAVLPAGTANDFALALGLSGILEEDIERILNGNIRDVDLIQANDRYFVNVLTSGLFTEVSQSTPTALKNNIGKLAYYISGIKELPKVHDLKLLFEADGFRYSGECFMFFIFNGKTAGNINLSYKAEIDDGLFDVIIAVGSEILKVAEFVVKFLGGEHLDSSPTIIHFKTSELKITSEEAHGTDVDGEKGPDLPLHVKCIPGGLKVIC